MRERGRYQLQLMKTRSSSGVNSKIDLEFDVDSLRIRDIGEEDEADNTVSKGRANVLDQIKRSSTPAPDAAEEPAAKITAATDSTRLRAFLNTLE
jgi:hypothetical protein